MCPPRGTCCKARPSRRSAHPGAGARGVTPEQAHRLTYQKGAGGEAGQQAPPQGSWERRSELQGVGSWGVVRHEGLAADACIVLTVQAHALLSRAATLQHAQSCDWCKCAQLHRLL
jgi:hypothetical protein